MLDLILYIFLGLAVIVLSVWGGIVSAKSLPTGENRTVHITAFVSVGVIAFFLTFWVGIRSYHAHKDAADEQKLLNDSLDADGKLLSEANASLDRSRIDEATMKRELQLIGPLLATIHGDQATALSAIGSALADSTQANRFTGNRYELLKTADLKKETLDLVQNLRALVQTTEAQAIALNEPTNAPSTQQVWNLRMQKHTQIFLQFDQEYGTVYKVDAELLRNELMRREAAVPDAKALAQMNMEYDHPTNPIGLGMVADNLEVLAKSLPDKTPKPHRR